MFAIDPSIELDAPGYIAKVRAPFAVLQQLLGQPFEDVPEKCSTIWSLRAEGTEDCGVYLKDWQDEDDRGGSAVIRGR